MLRNIQESQINVYYGNLGNVLQQITQVSVFTEKIMGNWKIKGMHNLATADLVCNVNGKTA